MSVEIFRKMIEILETDANILMGKEGDDAEKRKQFEEVFYRIQKMEWKEQKIIMQTIDSLIDSFNERSRFYSMKQRMKLAQILIHIHQILTKLSMQ